METDSGYGAAEQAKPALYPGKGQPAEVNTITLSLSQDKGIDGQVVDLLTLSVLAQWLSRAIAVVGRERIGKLVEIYDITANLPPCLKETMLLLADLCSNGNRAEDAPADEYVPVTVGIQLLIELDSLLRYRSGALESIVLSQLLEKGTDSRKGSYG